MYIDILLHWSASVRSIFTCIFSDTNLDPDPDGLDPMSHAPDGYMSCEDLFRGGDNDFNDSISNLTVQSTADNNGSDNIIVGSASANTLEGEDVDNLLVGGEGNDLLIQMLITIILLDIILLIAIVIQ